jgi:uncharacterized protein YbaR (Trm112 family)
MNLTEIQTKLNKVACPMCHNVTLEVTLRCDLDYGECLASGKCQTCGTVYEINMENRILDDGKELLEEVTCPYCRAKAVRLDFRCELSSRQCFYVAGCYSCGKPVFPAA